MFKKATSVVLGVMILVSPLAVSAQTLPTIPANASLEQLQQIVAQLTQMLQQLLQQIANPPSNSIKVTAPNGGEQWEIGQLNTITWSPYSYDQYNPSGAKNPAYDVSAYLVDSSGQTVARIMDQGKASLHTYFNIDSYDQYAAPGQYYVRVVNNRTGAEDRSDALFTLVPRGIDLKINGSDGGIQLYDNQPVTVTLTAGTSFSSCQLNGVRSTAGGADGVSLTASGLATPFNGYAYVPYAAGSGVSIYVVCTKADGTQRSDTVWANVDASVTPSVKIIYPNGGEKAPLGQENTVSFSMSGVQSYSAALYRNDQWFTWIMQDVPVGKEGFTWTPSEEDLGAVQNDGQVYKIYITARKLDGKGYVDDKSDAPFSFFGGSVTTPAKPTCSVTYSPTVVSEGQLSVQWGATGASSRTYTLYKDGVKYYGPANTSLNGGGSFSHHELGTPGTIKRVDTVTGPGGTAECTTSVTVAVAPLPIIDPPPADAAPTCTIAYAPTTVSSGNAVATWTSTNATSRTYTLTKNGAHYFGPENATLSGAVTISHADLMAQVGVGTLMRTDTVTGPAGSATCSASVNVLPSLLGQATSQQSLVNLSSALTALEAALKAFLAR